MSPREAIIQNLKDEVGGSVVNFGDVYIFVLGDILKKVNISLDKLISIVISNGLSPLSGIADPSRAYSWALGQGSRGIPQFPGALRPADLHIVPSLSCDLLSCQQN